MASLASRIRLAVIALAGAVALQAGAANADVTANASDFTVSYSTTLQPGTLNQNPITSLYVLESDGTQISIEHAPSIAGSGPVTVTHTLPFRPTAALLIGLDLTSLGLSDGKTHIVMFMDPDFADSISGFRLSEAVPAVSGQPRLTRPYSTSAGTFGSGVLPGGASGNSKASLPSATLTRTTPPLASRPNSSSSASGFLMLSWITRASGRAP